MHFSSLFLSLLAAVTTVSATPVPAESSKSLAVRANDPMYDHFAGVRGAPVLVKDKYYAFEMTWPLGSVPAEEDTGESAEELKKVRAALGFDHIGIVIGRK
jgi:hypothetical protein